MGSKFFRRYRGEAAATGVMTLREDPDYSNGKYTYEGWIGTMGVKRAVLQIEGLTGAVELQGNNGDPDVAGEWFAIESISADGQIVLPEQQLTNFMRVNKTTHTSGDMTAILTLEG